MSEVDSVAMEVAAEETLRTSASSTAHGGQAPTGVGPPVPLRASLPAMVMTAHLTLRVAIRPSSLSHRRCNPHSEGWQNRLVLRPVPIVLFIPILRLMPIVRPILYNPLNIKHLMPTQPPPIPIQPILAIPQAQADPLLLPRCKMRSLPQMQPV